MICIDHIYFHWIVSPGFKWPINAEKAMFGLVESYLRASIDLIGQILPTV